MMDGDHSNELKKVPTRWAICNESDVYL